MGRGSVVVGAGEWERGGLARNTPTGMWFQRAAAQTQSRNCIAPPPRVRDTRMQLIDMEGEVGGDMSNIMRMLPSTVPNKTRIRSCQLWVWPTGYISLISVIRAGVRWRKRMIGNAHFDPALIRAESGPVFNYLQIQIYLPQIKV